MFYPLLKVGVLKSPTMTVCLFLPSVLPVFTLYVRCFEVGWIFIPNCWVFLMNWSFYNYATFFLVSYKSFWLSLFLSDISIAPCALFWSQFTWSAFPHPFAFSLCAPLNLKCKWTGAAVQKTHRDRGPTWGIVTRRGVYSGGETWD